MLVILGGGLVAWAVPLSAIVLVWPILFFVPGWVVIRRVAPRLPVPGAVGAAIVTSVYVSAHLVNVVARIGGFGRESIVVAAVAPGPRQRRVRARPESMARPARTTDPDGVHDRPSGGRAGLDRGDRHGPGGPPRAGHERLGRDARRLGVGRLELERLPRPRLDRLEHRGRQLPARGPVLRRRAADLSLVRRLPRRDHLDRGRGRHHRGVLPDQRAVRGRPRPGRLGAGDAAHRPVGPWPRSRRSSPAPRAAWAGSGSSATSSPARATSWTSSAHWSYDNTWADGWPYFKIASIFSTGFLPHRATTLGLPGLVVGRPAHRRVRRPAPGRRPARRDPGRAPCAVPVLRLPGDLSHRRPVRR